MPLALPDNPFRITPTPRFVYPGQLDEALAGMRQAVAEGRDAAVLAEPGMGKTLLLRLLGQAHERAAGVVRYAAAGPGFDSDPLLAPAEAPLLVLIDDAHALGAPALRAIRDAVRAKREAGGAISLVLAGRPRFEPVAAEAELVLDWRLLSGLPVENTAQLVRDRLRAAGCDGNAFADDALQEIARRSRGVPRLVNLACSNALFRAQAEEAEQVTLAHARAALESLALPEPSPAPEAAPEPAPPPAPSTVIGQAGAAMAEPGPRSRPMGWRALASGLALFVGGLAGLGLLVAVAEPGPPSAAVATMAPAIVATPVSAESAAPAAPPGRQPPHVVFHYSAFDPAGERTARRLAEKLAEGGYAAAAMRPVRARIDSTTVRYFFDDDLGAATRIRDLMARRPGGRGESARVQDLTHYEPKPAEGAIEIWLGRTGGARGREDSDLRRVRATVAPVLRPAARDWP